MLMEQMFRATDLESRVSLNMNVLDAGTIPGVMNLREVLNAGDGEAAACAPVRGDMVAVVGENRRLIVFPLSELPEMTRGRGVKLQSYRDGGLSDVTTFARDDGLPWRTGAGVRREKVPPEYLGKRAQAGRVAMRGFPRNNRFGNYE